MIFLVLGTQKFQMNRLLKLVDRYVADGLLQEKVVAQTGQSDYIPKHYEHYDFMEKPVFESYIEASSVVITHSGVGSIISALKKGKPVIAVPRLAKFNEHVDDHQLEIARTFAQKGYILYCSERDNLLDLISRAKTHTFQTYISQTDNIVDIINVYINSH